jgi:hypothetical protein
MKANTRPTSGASPKARKRAVETISQTARPASHLLRRRINSRTSRNSMMKENKNDEERSLDNSETR